ncbi:type II toxin-antitoxin system mRNA interferase toxin, RelE/StbE family [Mergibacter septicus]|uniref:type II toxin-antitoxin system RelE/ParE family toxin n=1 Tax=Mergibacter septicus TaxID=221402 RepID=UPI0011796225|nr:type II toxin-antitoxin system YafQ family toxin [Mergibacter septicus]AWX13547.1 type II toxin-antitoxin system mRNA interferase toxin, RelE/StbE family [Mergibacter septicus]
MYYPNVLKKDITNLSKSHPEILISKRFTEVFNLLINGKPLPEIYKDHALSGNMQGIRDCHIYNDLILLYEIKEDVISFIRLGSPSELFD